MNKGKLTKLDYLRIRIGPICKSCISLQIQVCKQFLALGLSWGFYFRKFVLFAFANFLKQCRFFTEKYFKYRCPTKCSITQPEKNNYFKLQIYYFKLISMCAYLLVHVVTLRWSHTAHTAV